MTVPHLVSLVITTFNRSDALLLVLQGLMEQTDKAFEVIVADDGSTHEHVRALMGSEYCKALKVLHVWHPNIGFTASKIRNRGVAASNGDYIVLMDGDCVPEIDFVANHRTLAEKGFFVNGSRVLLSQRLTMLAMCGQVRLWGRSSGFWLLQRLRGHTNKFGGTLRLPDWLLRIDRGKPWTRVRSCNFAVWKTDYTLVDGFDESFVGWGHEDADFALRLSHAGVVRKNGFWATEVFHLWHNEAARASESHNAAVVAQRAASNITLPTLGYSRRRADDDAVTTTLG